ncbi:protoheme IX farnesyltransferase [Klebsiella michiganensis]|uniref:Protoheme IX farnesyltransferase n=1 Tax=Klebsiella michiganensis TaxID=1134687 RepID=A0A7H4LYP6_9ENTR|nr:protoheme IX farnesyltransferase [Klebsiella michiganensis]
MLLWFGANPLACWLGVMGFVVYVGVYSLYMKRHSVYGTLIGSLSALRRRCDWLLRGYR